MKRIAFILAILWPVLNVFCQTRPQLKVGDFVENLPSSYYTNKPTILYFFATWCQPCIQKMPKLDSMVMAHNGNLRIIPVTYESKNIIDALRKKNKAFASIQLPIVYKDSLLRQIFPYRLLPHVVWLNNGKIIAISGSDAITTRNIDLFVTGKQFSTITKRDQIDFDRTQPLIENGNGGTQKDLVFRTVFTHYLPGIGSGLGFAINSDSTTRRIYYLNKSLPDLFAAAANIPHYSDKIRINVADKSKYKRPEDMPFLEWAPTGAYSFEITIPLNTPDSTWRHVMMETLNLLSPLHAVRKGNHLIISEKN